MEVGSVILSVYLLGVSILWDYSVAQMSGGRNVCTYSVNNPITYKQRGVKSCYLIAKCSFYETRYSLEYHTRYKCCENWYPSRDGKNCDIPICHHRRGADAGTCQNDGECVSPGNCLCSSPLGFSPHDCSDINECLPVKGPCSHQCVNTVGSYHCACPDGFGLLDQLTCAPKCHDWPTPGECPNNGTCEEPNKCHCLSGFQGAKCDDIDECMTSSHQCSHKCENTMGGYTCSCPDGHQLVDEHNCKPVCFGSVGTCPNQGTCSGPNQCDCLSGYQAPDCEDIDECKNGTHQCSHQCKNTMGGFTCSCPDNYQFVDEYNCKPVCFGEPVEKCSNGGTCTGPDKCDCAVGFSEPKCEDTNECDTNNGGCHQICNNTHGSYTCQCEEGYQMSPEAGLHGVCEAVCVEGVPPGECLNGGTCVTPGVCRCPDDYQGNTCADPAACTIDNGGCSHQCSDTDGIVQCACPEGYELVNGKICNDIDECSKDNPCDQKCLNTVGSYTCGCEDGYELTDSVVCSDVNECTNDVCEQDCENTEGSYVCKCWESYVRKLDGECMDIKLCEPEDDPSTVGCAPLCTGRRTCYCPDFSRLHTNGKHCIDPCVTEPCIHGGKCLVSWDGVDTCDCSNTGYTGLHCEKGVIRMPPRLSVRAGMTYPNIHINAKPDKGLKLTLPNSNAPVEISPNPVVVDQNSGRFNLLVAERGRYNLTFDISGASAGDFPDKQSVFVEANDVFSRLKLRNRALPSGCFWYQLKFHQHRLWFVSTSAWYRVKAERDTAPVVFTKGVVMLVNDAVQLPMSSEGVEITADSEIKLDAVKSLIEDAILLSNHKGVDCTEMFLSERDMVEFREARSIFWTLFKNLEEIVPYYIQLSPVAEKAEKAIPFKPEILSGQSVQGLDVCVGAPTEDDKLYVVFRFQDPFMMAILEEKFPIKEGDFCIIVDMLNDASNTVTFMFSQEAGARFRNLDLIRTLEKESYIRFYFTGFSVSPPGQIRLPSISQDLQFWNGANTFTYPFAEKAVVWARLFLKRKIDVTDKMFDFNVAATVVAYMANVDPDSVFTHLFINPREVFIQLEHFLMEFVVKIFGKQFSFRIKDFFERQEGVLAMGGENGDRIHCGPAANPPGAFVHVSVNEKVLQGFPVIEDFILGLDGQLSFFKTFPDGADKGNRRRSWTEQATAIMDKFRTAAETIQTKITSTDLPSTGSSVAISILEFVKSQAINITEHTSRLMEGSISLSRFADFTKFASTSLYQLVNAYLNVQDLLSTQLDSSMDDLIEDLAPLILNLRSESGQLVSMLYNVTIPFFPNMGTWGLKGKFGLTVLGLFVGFEGEVVVSDESVMPCQSRFSDFYEHLENDKAVRALGVVSWQKLTEHTMKWGPLFWKYLAPKIGFGIEIAFSMTRVRFVLRVHVRWSLLGVKATGDLFVSTKGIFASVEGNLFDIFRIRLTVGAEYSLKPQEWGIWIRGDFLPGGDDSFTGSLWDAVRKAAKKFGESASARLKAGQRTMRLAQQALASAQRKVEQAKAKVRSKEGAFDAAVAKLEETKKKLEIAKAPFKSANSVLRDKLQKLQKMCQIRTCPKVCLRQLISGNSCPISGMVKYPCFQANTCILQVYHPACVVSNVVCRVKRGLVYAALKVAQAAVHAPMLLLEGAKAALSVSQIVVDKSRGLLKVAEVVLDGTKLMLKGVQFAALAAEKAFAGLQKALQSGLALLDAFIGSTLQTFIDFKTCGFKTGLSAGEGFEFEVYCEINFMRTGWKKHQFVINFKNIVGSLWKVAKTYLKKAMTYFKLNRRKRRDVAENVLSLLHKIFRRESESVASNNTCDPEVDPLDTTKEFWSNQCRDYQSNFAFISKSIEILQNISVKVYYEAEEAETNSSAYFEEFDVLSYINKESNSSYESEEIFKEHGISEEQVNNAIRNIKLEDDSVMHAFASSVDEVVQSEQEIIREYKNNYIVMLWKTEMENYTIELVESEDCQGFTDCLLFAMDQLTSMMDSVKLELVEQAVENLSIFDNDIRKLLENDTQAISEMTVLSSLLVNKLQEISVTDVFCGTSPQMIMNPVDITVEKGWPASLSCLADAKPPASYSWYKDGALIPDQNTSSLYFPDVGIVDEGNYTCAADNHFGNTMSSAALLRVVYPPEITGNWPEVVRVSPGEEDSLVCNVSAVPQADIFWFSTDRTSPVSSDEVLVLGDLPDSSAALYKCSANNTYGRAQSSEIAIYVKPKVTACPSINLQATYTSRDPRVGEEMIDIASYTSNSTLKDIFKSVVVSITNGSYPGVNAEFLTFDEENKITEISLSQPCGRLFPCSVQDCESMYQNKSDLVVSSLDRLIRVMAEETALFARDNVVYYFTGTSISVRGLVSICPEGYVKVSMIACVPRGQVVLKPPTDLKLLTDNGRMTLQWSPPDYANNFVTLYQLTVRNNIDGKTLMVNVTGLNYFLMPGGNNQTGKYDVTVRAFTQTHSSLAASIAFDVSQAGKSYHILNYFLMPGGKNQTGKYDVTVRAFTQTHSSLAASITFDVSQTGTALPLGSSHSTAVVAVGVSVALCILMLALLIVGKKLYASKQHPKSTSLSSFSSAVSGATRSSLGDSDRAPQSDSKTVMSVPVPVRAWGDDTTSRPVLSRPNSRSPPAAVSRPVSRATTPAAVSKPASESTSAAASRPVSGSTSAAVSRPGSRSTSAASSNPGSRSTSAAGSRPGSRSTSAAGSRPGSRSTPTVVSRPAWF